MVLSPAFSGSRGLAIASFATVHDRSVHDRSALPDSYPKGRPLWIGEGPKVVCEG